MDCNSSCEPMDIDLSTNSVNAMDISYNDNNLLKIENEGNRVPVTSIQTSAARNFKKLVVDLRVRHSKSKSHNNNTLVYILGLMFLLISGLFYHLRVNFKCCESIDTEKLRSKLSSRLYGQTTAASELITTLEDDINIKMLIMYGRTGVGKTLTVSILLEDLLNYANVYHYTMPSFVDVASTELLLGLTWCKSSIIIIDDLKNNDILEAKETVKNLVTKSENLNKNLTIILIYNCDTVEKNFTFKCISSFASELKQNFSDINVSKQFIEFIQLDNNVLRKCVEYELGNKEIDEEVFRDILRNFDVTRNGCKGVHQKMKYLNII